MADETEASWYSNWSCGGGGDEVTGCLSSGGPTRVVGAAILVRFEILLPTELWHALRTERS